MKLLTTLFALFVLTGCALTSEEIDLETDINKEWTARTKAKAETASEFAQACVMTQPAVDCQGDPQCQAMVMMGSVLAYQAQSQCVQSVAKDTANVAIAVPQARKAAAADIAESIFGKWLNNNTGVIASAYLGKEAFDLGKVAVTRGSQALQSLGRPNIDNSVTTSITEDNDHTETHQAGDTTVTSVGRDQIGRDSAGRDITGGDRSETICEGPDCRNNSPGDNLDDQDNSDNSVTNPPDEDVQPDPGG
jgi:hypothetical protein